MRIRRGDSAGGVQDTGVALDDLQHSKSGFRYPEFLGILAEGMGGFGEVGDGLAVGSRGADASERREEHWCMPEFLRIKGEILLVSGAPDAEVAAEDNFLRPLGWARRQGALSWELRTAMSLARLQRDQGRIGKARDLLSSVYGHFTEGFATADLQSAKWLINELV